MIGSVEGIKLVCTGGKDIDTLFGNVDGTTIGLDVVTELVSLDGSFDGFYYYKNEGIFLGDSLGHTE